MGRWMSYLAAAALVVPAALAGQGPAAAPPACSGELDGQVLTTMIKFPDGYAVEAPWNVLANRPTSINGAPGYLMSVHLDHIVEHDGVTGQATTTPFPSPIETTFEGATVDEVVYQAAQVWCMTVLRVRAEGEGALAPQQGQRKLPIRTTMAERQEPAFGE